MTTTALSLDEIVISRLEPGIKPESTTALHEAILQEQRLTGRALKLVAKRLPRQIVAGAIGINTSNLSKLYYRKRLSRVQSERISDLTATWSELNDVFMHDDNALNEWLHSKLPALSGRPPAKLLETIVGRKALREILNRLRYADFS
ncbi:DUF2384 domain-containing protein [Ferrimonas sediminicola]|uniref:DUF2384 domain-containing protein n=1 Tax=Ferrimonas sediminicola TaxID=2569538 RepID=A0A4U1BI91_9GAMM|nr:antitoxin Xre/MbcA/ParS toxin-binding domain-containing protein [Ferrimonas sediminicola]TKB51196.1 DUF2384 domain-containing protein [Ferrimonas sediminicola]